MSAITIDVKEIVEYGLCVIAVASGATAVPPKDGAVEALAKLRERLIEEGASGEKIDEIVSLTKKFEAGVIEFSRVNTAAIEMSTGIFEETLRRTLERAKKTKQLVEVCNLDGTVYELDPRKK